MPNAKVEPEGPKMQGCESNLALNFRCLSHRGYPDACPLHFSEIHLAKSALLPGCENDSKPSLAAHHAFVGFGGALQRIDFGHCAYAGEFAKGQRVLRIN